MIRLLALAAALAAPVTAQSATWTLNVTGPIDLGTVVAGANGDTVFRVSASTGAVTVVSGTGRRLSAAPAQVRVDISCRPVAPTDTACQTTNIPIRIGNIGATTGRARPFSAFNVFMDSSTLAGPITGANPLNFTLSPLGDNVVRTFYVSADFPVAGDDSNQPTGLGENAFYVYALDGGGATRAGDVDQGRVVVLRSLSIAATAPLNFGRIQLPSSGASTVSFDAGATGRTVDGTAVGYPSPAPTQASFTVAGEGGQQVSINVPATIQLAGPTSLTVTLSKTTPASVTLPGALGAKGSYGFQVGGRFTISPSTLPGAYSGVLTVTADYN